jgi:hypothetical protein
MRGTNRAVLADASVPTAGLGGRWPDVQVLVGRQRYDGALLAASDTLLLLHPIRRPYDWQAPAVVALDPADVDWVTVLPQRSRPSSLIVRSALVLGGVALALPFAVDQSFSLQQGGDAALLGGIVAGYTAGQVAADAVVPSVEGAGPYPAQLPALRARARFRFPADLPAAEAAARGRGSAAIAPAAATPRGSLAWRLAEWRRAHGWVSVAVLGPATWSGAAPEATTFQETISNRPTPMEQGVEHLGVAPSYGLDVALRPVPWVRLGAVWQRHVTDDPELPQGIVVGAYESARAEPGAFRGYAEVVVPTPRARGFGLDLAVGLGLERMRTVVERQAGIGPRDLSYQYETAETGTFLQGTVELVTPRRASFFVRYTGHPALPPVEVEGAHVGQPGFPALYTREAHTVEFGALREVTFGTRFRF